MSNRRALRLCVEDDIRTSATERAVMAHRRPLRVLMADDYEANRMVQLAQLEQLGYPTDAVANGEEVIRALAARDYDVVLLDIGMPVMDGVETVRRIRARRNSQQPFLVAVTAGTAAVDRARFRTAGFDAFIAKPAGIEDFVTVLEQAHTALYGACAGDSPPSPEVSGAARDAEPLDGLLRRRVAPAYLRELPGRIGGLRAAFEARDTMSLASRCHALKGASRILGATTLAALCDDIERCAYDGRLPDVASLDDLVRLATDTGEELRRRLAAAET